MNERIAVTDYANERLRFAGTDYASHSRPGMTKHERLRFARLATWAPRLR